jgi:hypothetical protein
MWVLAVFHVNVEVHHESPIFLWPQNLVQEFITGASLLVQNADLAAAGVHEQADGKRQVGLL